MNNTSSSLRREGTITTFMSSSQRAPKIGKAEKEIKEIIISLDIFYFTTTTWFLSCPKHLRLSFRQCSVVASSLGQVAAPFFNDVQVPPDHFLTLKKTKLAEILSLAHLMPCAAACGHNVARLVTSGLGRRFLATSPAADQQPAFGVLEATEAKSHLPNFDLVRLLRGRFRRACAVFTSLISHFVGVCARSCWTYENRTSGRPASSGPRRPSRSVRVSRTSSFAPPQPRSRC